LIVQLASQRSQCRFSIAPLLANHVEKFAIVIDSPPEVHWLAADVANQLT